ncbi:MAG: peroxiredoxin-like family protein [Planctomycetota bacterium]
MPIGRLAVSFLLLASVSLPARAESPQDQPSLNAELKQLAAGYAKRAPEAMKQAFAKGIADVKATGIVERALAVGQPAPDATLLTPDGKEVTLGSLQAEGPLVLAFYRGGWCPYCNTQLRALQRSIGQIEAAGATLVAVAPEQPAKVQQTIAKNDLTLTVLTDPGNMLAKKFGIAFTLPPSILPIYEERIGLAQYNGDNRNQLPLAATYVIDPGGVIRYAFVDADYKRRAEPSDVVAAIEKIGR